MTLNTDTLQGSGLSGVSKNKSIAQTVNGTKYAVIIPKSYSSTTTKYTFRFSYADVSDDNNGNVNVDTTSMETIEIIQRPAILSYIASPGTSGISQNGDTVKITVKSSNYWYYKKGDGDFTISSTNNPVYPMGQSYRLYRPSVEGSSISVVINKNPDPNNSPKYELYIYSVYTSDPSKTVKDNTLFFKKERIVISQGSAAVTSGFELTQTASGTTALADTAFNNISKDGCKFGPGGMPDSINPPRKFWIKNVGNTAASFKLSVDNVGKSWIDIGTFSDQDLNPGMYEPSSDTIEVNGLAAGSTQGIYFIVDENTEYSEPRTGEIIVRQTTPAGGDEKRVTVTQMSGNRNFSLELNPRDTQIAVVGNTITGTVTNTGIVTTDYLVSISSPYNDAVYFTEDGGRKNTIVKSSVKKGQSFNFTLVFTVNGSTDMRSGISITVQDKNEYGLMQTVNFTQQCFNEPNFNLTVTRNGSIVNQNTGIQSGELTFTMSG